LFQLFIISLEFEFEFEFESGIVANNATGDVSVDQYHRYKVSGFMIIATKQKGHSVCTTEKDSLHFK
jgi:hypothetical protein